MKVLVLRKDIQKDKNLFSLFDGRMLATEQIKYSCSSQKNESLYKHTMHFSACWLCANRPYYSDLSSLVAKTRHEGQTALQLEERVMTRTNDSLILAVLP